MGWNFAKSKKELALENYFRTCSPSASSFPPPLILAHHPATRWLTDWRLLASTDWLLMDLVHKFRILRCDYMKRNWKKTGKSDAHLSGIMIYDLYAILSQFIFIYLFGTTTTGITLFPPPPVRCLSTLVPFPANAAAAVSVAWLVGINRAKGVSAMRKWRRRRLTDYTHPVRGIGNLSIYSWHHETSLILILICIR